MQKALRNDGSAADRRAFRRIREHIEHLSHATAEVAARAVGHLVRYYGERAVEPLIEACAHADPQVRSRAVWALGQIHDPRAYETILRLTRDPDPAVRYDAAWALGRLGDPRAVEPLIQLMNMPDPQGCVDGAAAQGLSELGKPAVPALIENLQKGSREARRMAAYALGGIADEASIEPLARLLSDADEWLRIAGIEALAQFQEQRGEASCQQRIEECCNDPVARVRENASYWLKELQVLEQKRS